MIYKAQLMRESLIIKRAITKEISMQQAADEIGISKATYSRLESRKHPDIETFAKVCKWLEKDMNTFFEENDYFLDSK